MTRISLTALSRLCLRIYDSDLFAWVSLTALSRLCLRIYDSDLFAWISLTALSRLCLRIYMASYTPIYVIYDTCPP